MKGVLLGIAITWALLGAVFGLGTLFQSHPDLAALIFVTAFGAVAGFLFPR